MCNTLKEQETGLNWSSHFGDQEGDASLSVFSSIPSGRGGSLWDSAWTFCYSDIGIVYAGELERSQTTILF
jgi:hypothetical protein